MISSRQPKLFLSALMTLQLIPSICMLTIFSQGLFILHEFQSPVRRINTWSICQANCYVEALFCSKYVAVVEVAFLHSLKDIHIFSPHKNVNLVPRVHNHEDLEQEAAEGAHFRGQC